MEREGSSPCSQEPATCPYPVVNIFLRNNGKLLLIL
jgi:hypothetical protein